MQNTVHYIKYNTATTLNEAAQATEKKPVMCFCTQLTKMNICRINARVEKKNIEKKKRTSF